MSFKTRVNCETENLQTIRTFVERSLYKLHVPEKDLHLLVVAVDEICANRMIHSSIHNSSDKIEVVIKKVGNEVVFEIIDNGEHFNISEYVEPSIEHVIKEKSGGGIGLILVKKIIDQIQLETHGSKNVCRLSKFLKN